MKHLPTTSHNYLPKLLQISLATGGIYTAEVKHDDWCDLLNGCGFCNCDPQIALVETAQGKSGDSK